MARQALTRDRIVTAAVAVADADGIERLTIRSLAGRLTVAPMAVYHHFPDKESILDGVVDAVFAEIVLPVAGGAWRHELERRCRSARDVLVRHPWAVPLLESRRRPGAATLSQHDAVLGVLFGDGFSAVAAGHAFALVDAFVFGFVVQETSLPVTGDDVGGAAADMLGSADATYPHLTRFAAERLGPGYEFAAEFDVGLGLVLDACASLRS